MRENLSMLESIEMALAEQETRANIAVPPNTAIETAAASEEDEHEDVTQDDIDALRKSAASRVQEGTTAATDAADNRNACPMILAYEQTSILDSDAESESALMTNARDWTRAEIARLRANGDRVLEGIEGE